MRIAGLRQGGSRVARLAALGVMAGAVALAAWTAWRSHPSSDEASIDAELVHVSAAVGGRILKLPVRENDLVHKGDLLLQIDPLPYQLAVDAAAAQVALARAALDTQSRLVATQRSNATLAHEQVQRAETNYGLSQRTEERLKPLTDKGYVPRQQLDQAQTALRDADTSRRQAREQAAAARGAIGTLDGAVAGLAAAQAALAQARRALEDTTVRAEHEGRVVGLMAAVGEHVAPSQSLMNLIATEAWYAVANLRETELEDIKPGDCATVYSMLDRRQALRGQVESIGYGVSAGERIQLPRSVPYVRPSLNWVRVAQRFPVRIRLHEPPETLMRLGASASVELLHGAGCR